MEGWSPTGCPKEETSAACSGCSTSRPARHLGDEIPETRAATVGWLPDASGFLYTRYPEGAEYGRMVYEHRLGMAWREDALVWGDLPTPEAWTDVSVSRDGRWVLVHVSVSWSRTDVHLLDRETGHWRTVIEGIEATTALSVDGDRLLGVTNLDAPRGRVVTAPLTQPDDWDTLVPERQAVIDAVVPAGDVFYVLSTDRSIAVLEQHHRDGGRVGEVTLPDVGTLRRLRRRSRHGRGLPPARVVHEAAGAASGQRARRRRGLG